jgi:hypothetical protein
MRYAKHIFALMIFFANQSDGSEQSTGALAAMMKQAKYSAGFEARMNVLVTKANGARGTPFKVAVIGQFNTDKQRVRINGVAPESVRARFFAAERNGDGDIQSVAYSTVNDAAQFDSNKKLFNSELVIWDMFSPWWSWPKQAALANERINARECINIRSVSDDINLLIREVESCVDVKAKLSIRTRFFDSRHTLIRTATVWQTMRKGDSDALAAKKLTITDAAGTVTEIEVYAGDEQYQITTETFSALDVARNKKPGPR